MELIQYFFGSIGNISINKNLVYYRVRNKKDLLVIKSHFMDYPLQTSKFYNFHIFYQILDLISKKNTFKI